MTAQTLLWILLAQAIGGSSPALTKLALDGLGPFTLVLVRQVLGFGFLLLMMRVSTGSVRLGLRETVSALSGRDWILVLTISWAGFALPQTLGAVGLELSATHGALLTPLEPVGILLGGALLLGERLTAPRLAGVVLGVAGASLIVLGGESETGGGNLRGDLIMAVGHLAWAIYTLGTKPLLGRHDPLRIALLASALTPIPLVPLALGESLDLSRALPAFGWIVLLAFLATALGTYSWNRALRDVSAGTMAAFIFLQPACGLMLGTLLLGEPVGLRALLGATLIVAGVTVAALRGEARAGDEADSI